MMLKWFAFGLGNATVIPSSLASLKSTYPFSVGLPGLSWKSGQ